MGRFPPVCCTVYVLGSGAYLGAICAAEQCVASRTHVFQLKKQIMNPSTCHPRPECSILQPRSNSDGGLQQRESMYECVCEDLVISDSGAHS